MKKLLIMMMAILAACSMLLAGCGGGEKKAAEKVMRVATEPSFAPFEFQKEGSKEFTGFDMDLIRAIGKQAGYKVEIQNMGFDALIPALTSNNIDVAIAHRRHAPLIIGKRIKTNQNR
ncbi:MAG: transporter substrate-binding domain-containing protein, partial [Phascolarctobacterium sp.]|nr:transporter substrate-binding domain-containing protein [Phascolarctobacterium sp.]